MADDDDLEPRVSALENEVRDLRGRVQGSEHDAAAARILAGAADRDVGEFRTEMRGLRGEMNDLRTDLRGEMNDLRTDLRGEMNDLRGEMRDFRSATTASFNAQRQDFVDLRKEFVDLREHVDQGFAEMRGKFDGTAAGLQQITHLLQTIVNDRPQP